MRILATLQEPDAGTIHLGEINAVRQRDGTEEAARLRHRPYLLLIDLERFDTVEEVEIER